MKTAWKWILGVVLALLLIAPWIWRYFLPIDRYGMMGYGSYMPMMYGGFGMMGFGMILMWLIPLGLLALIGIGIVLLMKELTASRKI